MTRLLALCMAAAAVTAGCREPAAEKPIRPVKAVKVGDMSGLSRRSFPGRAKATEEVNLSFRVAGPLTALPIQVGDEVAKGDVLAQIDPTDFEVDLRSAEGNLAQAQANLDAMKIARPEEIEQLKAAVQRAQAEYNRARDEYARAAELVKTKVISQTEFDRKYQIAVKAQADLRTAQEDLRIGESGARKEDILAKEAEIKSLRAAVDAAANRLQYAYLKAPFDGSIAATYVENFQTVQAKEPILRLLDTTRIEMIIDMPESMMSMIPYAKDFDIVCRFDAFPDLDVPAKIKEIGTEASQTTRTYPITLIMDQPEDVKILPGMAAFAQARGELPQGVKEAGFEIPDTAIFTDEKGQKFVWAVDESTMTVSRLPVEPVDLTPRGLRVSGLEAGQWIATAGVHYLEDGQQVRIPARPAKEESK